MNINIENINIIEKRHKVYTNDGGLSAKLYKKKIDETDIFPDDFIKICKNNENEAHNIPLEVKK